MRSVSRLARGLGHPEIDDLRDRVAVLAGDEDIRRLDVPVDDPLLMRVVDRMADLDEEPEALPGRKTVPIAEMGDGNALHVLHHEVRTALLRGSGVKDLRDVHMIHHGESLTLRLEAGDHLLRVHAQLDDLESDLPLDRFFLFREVDLPHPAGAEEFEEMIVIDLGADKFGRGTPGVGAKRPRIVGQKAEHFGDERIVATTLPSQKRLTFRVGQIGGSCERDRRSFRGAPGPCSLSYGASWLLSQARANRTSFFTVFSETPRVSADSRTLSPPKKRRSMICACLSLVCSSRSRASLRSTDRSRRSRRCRRRCPED